MQTILYDKLRHIDLHRHDEFAGKEQTSFKVRCGGRIEHAPRWSCSLTNNHPGPHRAFAGLELLSVWEEEQYLI